MYVCVWLAPFLSTGDLAVIFQDQATAAKPLGSSSVTGAAYINVVGLLKREREKRVTQCCPLIWCRTVLM